jgi:imidazolonepropionase-like amidohydrolase
VVVITDDKITAAGPAASVTGPAGAKVIDLGGTTLLPGFIDAHTHIIGRVLGDSESDDAVVRDYDSFGAILGVRNDENGFRPGLMDGSIRNGIMERPSS